MSSQRSTSPFERLRLDKGGNFAIATALMLPVLLVTAGGTVDTMRAFTEKNNLQEKLDGAVLAAAHASTAAEQKKTVEMFLARNKLDLTTSLSVESGADGSVHATITPRYPTTFLNLIGISAIPIRISSGAIAERETTPGEATPSGSACIHVLANQNNAVLINSGADVRSSKCEAHIVSTSAQTFIMNGGSTVNLAKFCVKGTGYLKNGGTLANLETECNAKGDPYAGKIAEPDLPKQCMTQGAIDSTTITFKPGMHCSVNVNRAANITFKPGLHIIRGPMNIASNSTIVAEDVTFYFPDTDSELRANGGVSFTATAPAKGDYTGILMFEKTSEANNNASKRQYIFNSSRGETLSGIIHLPNRDVVYNSTTNVTANISLVVNTMIINSANWQLEPYMGKVSTNTGNASADNQSRAKNVRLIH